MRSIGICGLSGCAAFFHIIAQTARFSKKKKTHVIEIKMCFSVFSKAFETFLIVSINERDVIKNIYLFHVKYRHSRRILTKLGFLATDFRKVRKYQTS
jgi:hypothetical protein